MVLDPRQVKAARILLGWSQEQLAKEAKCARASVSRFEAGSPDTKLSTVVAILTALKKAGMVFFDETEERGIGLRLKEPEAPAVRNRRRAGTSGKKGDAEPSA